MSFPAHDTMFLQDVNEVSSTKKCNLGARRRTDDGREWVYAKLDSVHNAIPGKLFVCPAATANHTAKTATAVAAGAVSATLTVGATAVTEDQYKDGFFVVYKSSSTGPGQIYRITSNTAALASGSPTFQFSEPVRTAITTSETVSLFQNPWNGVTATVTYGPAAGFAQISATSGYYLWLLTKGPGIVYAASAFTVGWPFRQASASVGGVQPMRDPDGSSGQSAFVSLVSWAPLGVIAGLACSNSEYVFALISID